MLMLAKLAATEGTEFRLSPNHTEILYRCRQTCYIQHKEYFDERRKKEFGIKPSRVCLFTYLGEDDGTVIDNEVSYKDEELAKIVERALELRDRDNDDANGTVVDSVVTYKDEDLVQMVEGALKQADKNDDGYITYVEFKGATGQEK